MAIAALTLAVPYIASIAGPFGLVPLPWHLVLTSLLLVAVYLGANKIAKVWYYSRETRNGGTPAQSPKCLCPPHPPATDLRNSNRLIARKAAPRAKVQRNSGQTMLKSAPR